MRTLISTAVRCLLAAFLMLGFCGSVRAQRCLHGPIALPGLGGPPEWFDVDSDGVFRPELHDPRWSGTPLRALTALTGGGAVGEAQFRVLKYGDSLYFSIQSLVDDTPAALPDSIQIGFTEGSGAGANAIKLVPHVSGPAGTPPADPSAPHDTVPPRHLDTTIDGYLQTWHTTNATGGGGWGTATFGYAAVSSWLKDVAIWTNSPGVAWAVTLRIDMGPSGLNAPGDPKLFIALESSKSTGMVVVGNVTPSTTGGVGAGSSVVPPDPVNWEVFASSGAPCTSGVTLDRADVGVWSGPAGSSAGGSLSNQVCTVGTCGDVNNVFSVTARNVPAASVADWVLRPRIRVAQWGSTISDVRYAPFRDVHAVPAGADVYNAPAPPTAGATLTPANGWHWLAPSIAGATAALTMHYQCDRGTDPYCPRLDDESVTNAHQCMLVELGQRGADLHFENNAVFRNMHFAGLSTLDADATISIQGLEKATGVAQPRDVYLYVETHNMPAHGAEAMGLPVETMQAALRLADNPWPIPHIPAGGPPKELRASAAARAQRSAANLVRAPEAGLLRRLQSLVNNGKEFYAGIPYSSLIALGRDQLLDAVYPTYRVHAYYDSGEKVTSGEVTQARLVPMVPFGYYLTHDGALFGFGHSLLARPGVTLADLGGGWYKVSIASEGSAKLGTVLTAHEKPLRPEACESECDCKKCPGKHEHHVRCGCRIPGGDRGSRTGWLVISALGLAIWLRRRRRQR